MKKKYGVVLAILLGSSVSLLTLLDANPLVIKRKKDRISTRDLQEKCADSFHGIMKKSIELLEEVTHLQRTILERADDLFEERKESFMLSAKADELEKCYAELQTLEQKIGRASSIVHAGNTLLETDFKALRA
jgi:SMC interacting uncharacterized protein involved in chromosome segregation